MPAGMDASTRCATSRQAGAASATSHRRRWSRTRPLYLLATLIFGLTTPAAAHHTGNSTRTTVSANATGTSCTSAWEGYRADRARFNRALDTYWTRIGRVKKKRRARAKSGAALRRADFVMEFPPEYAGRPRPKCRDPRAKPAKPGAAKPDKPRSTLPIVADFLSAVERKYGYNPEHGTDADYMLQYAREALRLGMRAEQVVGVYALETGGLGPYFRQSGIFNTDQNCKPTAPRGRPASTALGYAQLLAANSNAMVHRHGKDFAARLDADATRRDAATAASLRRKADIVRRMARDIDRYVRRRSKRNGWTEYIAYGKTTGGRAVHAMNLDIDVGPMIQTIKLRQIIDAAAKKGYTNIDSATLEMLNLVGYGTGLRMLDPAAVNAPSANFLSRQGYYRNPVVSGETASGVRRKLGEIIGRKKKFCGSKRFFAAFEAAARNPNDRVGRSRPQATRAEPDWISRALNQD